MERAASATMRRCLRSGKALRCNVSASAIDRSRCVATSICPARNAAHSSSTTASHSTSASSPLSSIPRRVLRTNGTALRGYSTQESSIAGTIGKGEAGIADEVTNAKDAPAHLNEKEKEIWELLMKELECQSLEVQDISGGCGSMYGIDIVSEKFRGLGMLKQQRLVNEILKNDIQDWHGLQLKTRAP